MKYKSFQFLNCIKFSTYIYLYLDLGEVLDRNGQKCDRKWISDIQNGRRRPFCEKFQKKFCIDLKLPEMRSKVIFRKVKLAASGHFVKKITKIKIVVSIWNGQKCYQKWFLDIQNGCRGPFKKKHLQKSCTSDLNNVRTDCWPTTTWYKFTLGQYIYRQVCWGNIHCVRPLVRMHTILVI